MRNLLSPPSPNEASTARPSSRELEARFYREIGLSAVAAALSLQLENRELRSQTPVEGSPSASRLERRAG